MVRSVLPVSTTVQWSICPFRLSANRGRVFSSFLTIITRPTDIPTLRAYIELVVIFGAESPALPASLVVQFLSGGHRRALCAAAVAGDDPEPGHRNSALVSTSSHIGALSGGQ